jgi:tetratricopeptide (TPR) repeat protein
MPVTGRRQDTWQDALLIGAGFLALTLTYRTYRFFEAPTAHSIGQHLSNSEADRLISQARNHLGSSPEDFNAYAQLGIAYFNKGPDSYPEGLNAIEKARSLGATSEALFYYAGIMYDQMGLAHYAINELLKYNRHHPGDYEILVRLGNLYVRENQFEEAERYYKLVIGERPKDPTVWFNYAIVCKERTRYDDALAALAKARQLGGGQLPLGGDFQEGEILRLKGLPDQALVKYKDEVGKNPDYLPALLALESAARQSNDWKEARRLRQRIQELKSPKPLS